MVLAIQYRAENKCEKHYPFGMLMQERSYTATAKGYRFGFNGQESDDEVSGEGNSYAFKYRIHDARLGRFLSVDPLSPEYPWYSPYQFAGNKVIWARELEGLEEWKTNSGQGSSLVESQDVYTETFPSSDENGSLPFAGPRSESFLYDFAFSNNIDKNQISLKASLPILERKEFGHVKLAGSFIGIMEIKGANSNPTIDMFFRETGWKYGDETSWCAAFQNYCIKKGNPEIPSLNKVNALSFSYSGYDEVETPFYGSYMVRSDNGQFYGQVSTGHVALVVGIQDGAFALLGGNQAIPGTDWGCTVNVVLRNHETNYKYFHPKEIPRIPLAEPLFTLASKKASKHIPGSDR